MSSGLSPKSDHSRNLLLLLITKQHCLRDLSGTPKSWFGHQFFFSTPVLQRRWLIGNYLGNCFDLRLQTKLQMTEGTTNSGHISFLFQILLIFGPKKSGFPTHLFQVSRGTQRLNMLKICLFLCGPNFSRGNSIFYFFSQILQVLSCQETSYPALNPTKNMHCGNNAMEDN